MKILKTPKIQKVRTSVCFEKQMRDHLRTIAQEKNQSLSGYIQDILKAHLLSGDVETPKTKKIRRIRRGTL